MWIGCRKWRGGDGLSSATTRRSCDAHSSAKRFAAPELARNFLNTLPKVEAFLDRHSPPLIAKVYRPSPAELTDSGRPGRIELKLHW